MMMQIPGTKRFIPKGFDSANLVYCSISGKTWFKNKHFSDADRDKPDTKFLLLRNELFLEHNPRKERW